MIRNSRRARNPLLYAAIEYAERGWCIIPTKGKQPACQWKQFQRARPEYDTLFDLFLKPGITGLAVILGPISGGLVCRDFDDLDNYKTWKVDYAPLTRTLPTVRTSRGRHVYFTGPEGFEIFTDGEYRGDSSHYCLVPPSLHPDGSVYKWIIPPPIGALPVIDPWKAGLRGYGTESTEITEDGAVLAMSSLFSMFQDMEEKDGNSCASIVEEGILATQPHKQGQRSRKIFDLCRKLKAIPALAGRDPVGLRPIIVEWHRKALPVIGTKEFTETWIDFLAGWGKVIFSAGQGPVNKAFTKAMESPPPKMAVEQFPDEERLHFLAALCRELQNQAGEEDFFLACRTAGELLGVSHKIAWRWLDALCQVHILQPCEKGGYDSHRASRFRYISD